MTKLQLTSFEDETSKIIPVIIAQHQLINGALSSSLKNKLSRIVKYARNDVDMWEWGDENTLNQCNYAYLRVTSEESLRFCSRTYGSQTKVTPSWLIEALNAATIVIGVTVEDDQNIYATLVDGAGFGFTYKSDSFLDPAFVRIEKEVRASTNLSDCIDFSNQIDPSRDVSELGWEFGYWTNLYCKLNDLSIDDFFENFARFEEL